jgi:hypothetical protein
MIVRGHLQPSNKAQNYVVWLSRVDDSSFSIYIPKWRVPDPWPNEIFLETRGSGHEGPSLSRAEAQRAPELRRSPIVTQVKKSARKTKTMRYRPQADPSEWEIGEQYLPFSMTNGEAEHLTILVNWGA